jgi:hypothetical protein
MRNHQTCVLHWVVMEPVAGRACANCWTTLLCVQVKHLHSYTFTKMLVMHMASADPALLYTPAAATAASAAAASAAAAADLGLAKAQVHLHHSLISFFNLVLLLLLLQIWDLRKRKCIYTIPAHTSLVSTVRWQPGSGHVLLTAGYDCQAKLWSSRDWKLVKVLAGHEGKIMAADMCPVYSGSGVSSSKGLDGCGLGGGYEALVSSVSYDRTIKVWAPEDVPEVVGREEDGEGSSEDDDGEMMDD